MRLNILSVINRFVGVVDENAVGILKALGILLKDFDAISS